MPNEIVTLESENNRLQLVPELGGAIAAWEWKTANGWTPMFRPWDGQTEDRYTLACFPLVPWSNRITGGGFEQDGKFYPIALNREGEAYPIHGDGWLQPWKVTHYDEDVMTLSIESNRYAGNPYQYSCTQTFRLLPNGLTIDLNVTHLGDDPLPYGLGLHPYFPRNDETRLRFTASGIWLAGEDPIPIGYTEDFPDTYNYNQVAPLKGPLIDHCFAGWDGQAEINYPDRGLTLTMLMENPSGYTLMYRPPQYEYFCLEPITHPIDAFHIPHRPGLVVLAKGQSFALHSSFMVG